jgi:hypothetical protein
MLLYQACNLKLLLGQGCKHLLQALQTYGESPDFQKRHKPKSKHNRTAYQIEIKKQHMINLKSICPT